MCFPFVPYPPSFPPYFFHSLTHQIHPILPIPYPHSDAATAGECGGGGKGARLDYKGSWKETYLSLLPSSSPSSQHQHQHHTPLPSLPPVYSDVLYAPYGAVARFEKVKARLLRRKEKGILRLRAPTVEVREGGRKGGREQVKGEVVKRMKAAIKVCLYLHHPLLPFLPPSLPPSLPYRKCEAPNLPCLLEGVMDDLTFLLSSPSLPPSLPP